MHQFGWSNAINRVHMMNSDQLYGFLEEAYENDGMRMPRNITRLYHLDGEGLGAARRVWRTDGYKCL